MRVGSRTFRKMGVPRFNWGDLYHQLLTISWPLFLALIGLAYTATNALFALAYLADPHGIVNARPGSFGDAFFFSVQTMATIGYGVMTPLTTYANTLAVIEALTGLLGFAVVAGLVFTRFSHPTARVLFSRIAVVCPFNGVPTLMFRMANQRHNRILEARVRVTLLKDEVSLEGETMRRFHDLRLIRSQTPALALTWTVMHPIDQRSCLAGVAADELNKADAEILVTLTGLDETVSQIVHARYSYFPGNLSWNKRFVDIIGPAENGERYIDYTRFHDVETTPNADRPV